MSDPLSPGALADAEMLAAGYGVPDDDEPRWVETSGFPAPLDPAALHGLPGDVVRLLGPHTEGDPAAILVQFLAAFGSAVGRGPFFPVGGDHHHSNLYVMVVGETGKSRKGSGRSAAMLPVERADAAWAEKCQHHGVSTGEGIIHHVSDPKSDDAPPPDKRLLLVETEFARVLQAAARQGAILSMVLRQGWDGQPLETLTKTSPERAVGAHLSLIAHVTPADLREYLADTDVLNGFLNRFVVVASKRARLLHDGGELPAAHVSRLTARTHDALERSTGIKKMRRDDDASKLWREIYGPLTEGPGRIGAFGAATGRADAQVLRLSIVYALTDGSEIITEAHLRAALALWAYSEATALWVFGVRTGSNDADRFLYALRQVWPDSLPQGTFWKLVSRNRHPGDALDLLRQLGLATCEQNYTGERGRPQRLWTANPDPPKPGISSFICSVQREATRAASMHQQVQRNEVNGVGVARIPLATRTPMIVGDGPDCENYMRRWMADHPGPWHRCADCSNWRLTTNPNGHCPLCPPAGPMADRRTT